MLIMSNMGDHVWLITSRHTEPDLFSVRISPLNLERSIQLVNVGVEYAIDEADAG